MRRWLEMLHLAGWLGKEGIGDVRKRTRGQTTADEAPFVPEQRHSLIHSLPPAARALPPRNRRSASH